MGDLLGDGEISEHIGRVPRISLAQLKAIVEFMEKHPDLANRKVRDAMTHEDCRMLCEELSVIANDLDGPMKSPKGWIKFWTDKRRSILVKQKQIDEGKINDRLTPLDKRILGISSKDKQKPKKRKHSVVPETCNGDADETLENNIFMKDDEGDTTNANQLVFTETDERQISMLEKLVEVMDQQASAMSQMAEATLTNSKALERIAEASHKQAMAVDRLATTFESVNASVFDVRNAIMSIDYNMKRSYTATSGQHRQNSNIFT